MSKTMDTIIMGITGSASGWCVVDFTHSLATYQAQAEAITQKIYSAAEKITPEVVDQANQLISQVANNPDYFNGIFGALLGVLAIGLGTRIANPKNYE